MTGPEHYREAETLLERVEERGFGPEPDHIQAAWLSAAQVHATLALAAATAIGSTGTMPIVDADAWEAAAA